MTSGPSTYLGSYQHGDSPDENRLQITVNHTRNMSVLSVAEQLQRIPGVREIRHTLS